MSPDSKSSDSDIKSDHSAGSSDGYVIQTQDGERRTTEEGLIIDE